VCNLYFGSRSKRSAAARTCEARVLEVARRIYSPTDHAERSARLETRRATPSETRRVTSAREARVPYEQSACWRDRSGGRRRSARLVACATQPYASTSGVSHAMSQRGEGKSERTRSKCAKVASPLRHAFQARFLEDAPSRVCRAQDSQSAASARTLNAPRPSCASCRGGTAL